MAQYCQKDIIVGGGREMGDGGGGIGKNILREDGYRRGGSKLQSIFTLWPCYMVRKTAEGISTYRV